MRNIHRGLLLDEHFLITLASGGAVAIGSLNEATLVVLLYRLGDHLLSRALRRSRSAVDELVALQRALGDGADTDPAAAVSEATPTQRAEIAGLLKQAVSRKARSERLMTRFSRWYTPLIVGCAFLMTFVPPLLSADLTYAESVYRALTFLVLASPGALLVAVPLGWYAAVGTALRNGILVKGADRLETLARIRTALFGKTGTLTKGRYAVIEILPEEGMPKERLLHYAAHAEARVVHPVAAAVRAACDSPMAPGAVSDIAETPRRGVVARVEEQEVVVGTAQFLRERGLKPGPDAVFGTTVHVALAGYYIGRLVVADELRERVPVLVSELRKKGVRRLGVLSGDNEFMVRKTARAAGLEIAWGALSPAAKLERLEQELASAPGPLLFMGDRVDDAPLLARADVGVALGKTRETAVLETADIVLDSDDPSLLLEAHRLARRARVIVDQNLVLALAVKGILLFLAAVGIASLWEVVFADTIAALVTILNASRLIAGKSVQQELIEQRITA